MVVNLNKLFSEICVSQSILELSSMIRSKSVIPIVSLISQSLVNSPFTLAVPGTWMVLCRTFYAESEEGLGLEQRESYIPILSGIKTV